MTRDGYILVATCRHRRITPSALAVMFSAARYLPRSDVLLIQICWISVPPGGAQAGVSTSFVEQCVWFVGA